jgi:FkbM family methyltransferase
MATRKTDFIPPIILREFRRLRRDLLQDGSTGLNQLDLKLISEIKPSPGGYFIELGANDGIRQSNTYKLQQRYGWTGVLIEPNPFHCQECTQNRAFGKRPRVYCAACVPFDHPDRFIEIESADLMSVAKGLLLSDDAAKEHADRGRPFLVDPNQRFTYGAVARTLTDILKKANAPSFPDLLSLDVEGNELAVLQGLDFSKYRPQWILAECRDKSIQDHLSRQGYTQHKVLSENPAYTDLLFKAADGPETGSSLG